MESCQWVMTASWRLRLVDRLRQRPKVQRNNPGGGCRFHWRSVKGSFGGYRRAGGANQFVGLDENVVVVWLLSGKKADGYKHRRGLEFAILPTTSDCDDMRVLKDPRIACSYSIKMQSSGIAALTHILRP